ncbi:MAG: phage tail P2-like protein [Phenylobacterium sp.]|jgi:phage tail P2-like protein
MDDTTPELTPLQPSLLPLNQTPLEKLISQTLSPSANLSSGSLIRSVWNADTCPLHLLSYLAQAVAVDLWDHRWSEAQKRRVIKNALEIHRLKGTPHALIKALESRGVNARLREWWQTPDAQFWLPPVSPEPGTVVIEVLINDNLNIDGDFNGVSKAKLQQMNNAIFHAKRESIHLAFELNLKLEEEMVVSLVGPAGVNSVDYETELSPLVPEEGQLPLALGGATGSRVARDYEAEIMGLGPEPGYVELGIGEAWQSMVVADFEFSG